MGRVALQYRLLAAWGVFCLALFCTRPAHAAAEGSASSFDLETIADLYHITADRTLYHTREKVKEAFGHVVVSAEGKRLACDYLWVDDNTKDIIARGNVVFVDKKSTVEAAEIHVNFNTGFGSIFYGRVYNDLYSMRGQLIRRVGDDHYLTTEGEYSTCKDCPESWKLAARHVDLTVDGYAFMDGVFIKVKDVPTLYLPYMIVPVKTKRQTGLIFPRVGATSSHGFVYVQPLFIAIDKHQDATLAGGTYSAQGPRYEAQYRYKSYNGIGGQTDVYYSRDKTYQPIPNIYYPNRGAVKSTNEWPFDPHFGMRWRFFGSKDRDYTWDFLEDFNFQNYPAVESNVVAQAPFDDFYVSMAVNRYASLLYDDPVDFDTGMVQDFPAIYFGTKERRLGGPVLGNFFGRFDNFTRGNGPIYFAYGNGVFNTNFTDPTNPSQDRIREAQRTILTPEISAPFSVGKFFSVSPAIQYTTMLYHFPVAPPNLMNQTSTSVSYLRTYVNLSTVLEKTYDYNGETISKVQHQMVPFITASYIPKVQQNSSHPFEQQILFTDGPFDQFDVVPLTNSTNFEQFPQGKSIYYGFNSRVIRKKKRPDEMPRAYPYDLNPLAKPKTYPAPHNRKQEDSIEAQKLWDEFNPHYEQYQEVWDFTLSQAYDFISYQQTHDLRRAFSYVLAKSHVNFDDKFKHDLEYRYYPSIYYFPPNIGLTQPQILYGKTTFTTGLTWIWKKFTNLRKTRSFERSMTFDWTLNDQPNPSRTVDAGVVWSFNDFMQIDGKYYWDLNAQMQTRFDINAMITHPSECWGLALHWDWQQARQPNHGDIGFQLLLNLDGNGFTNTKGQGSGGMFGS